MKIDRYKDALDSLLKRGDLLHLSMSVETNLKAKVPKETLAGLPDVRKEYQSWYSEALACIRQLLPDRVEDFVGYYKPLKPRKTFDASTYTISDYLYGLEASRGGEKVVTLAAAVPAMHQQVQIVKALRTRFESSLYDIRTLVQADFFDDELEASRELNGKGFHRAAGAVAGVVLEEHLASVANQHRIPRGKNPSIGDLNDLLKKHDILDIATWRFTQRLGDLRNLCDHKKSDEPTRETINELIDGVKKIIKTVF